MEFTKKESYAIQMGHYLRNKEYAKACGLAEEMIKKFPNEPLSHFMAAKAYYFSKRYESAEKEGRRAFNLAHTKHDMMVAAIVTASAQLMLGRYDSAYKMISLYEKEDNEDVKKLLVILSMVRGKGKKAGEYFKELYDLNMEVARKFIRRLAEKASAQ